MKTSFELVAEFRETLRLKPNFVEAHNNLGISLGTALAGAVLMSALTASFFTGIANNPAVPKDLTSKAQTELTSGVPFISDADLEQALSDAGVSPATASAVVDENATARIDALRASLSVLAVLALVALAMPPLFTNTYAGVVSLKHETVDAARGTGFKEWQLMLKIELPLALPVILAGARVAFLQLVATVAIGAIVNDGGGLGRYIVDGFAQGIAGYGEILGGAIAVIVLALLCEASFTFITRLATPKGLALQQNPHAEK